MYIERVPNRNSSATVLLRESWRENGKTKKRTVGNLSSLSDEIIETIRSALRGKSESGVEVGKVVGHYKNLASVERAFRSLKSIDLRVRPIHHRLADRVRSHIFLCTLAYYIEYHLRQLLAPLMFTDEDKTPAESRDSIVSPAPRSESAKGKDANRRNAADVPLASFRDILESLSTITRSAVIIADHPNGRFTTTSRPTAYQQEIIRHLGLTRHL